MDVDQHNALAAASDAVEAAASPAEAAAARVARNELIIKTYHEINESFPRKYRSRRYRNRHGPQAITKIVEATGLSRVVISRIVNDTPVVRGVRKSSDGSQDS